MKAGFTPGPEDEACHYRNGEWNCAADSINPTINMINRDDVTDLGGDWAMRNSQGKVPDLYLPLVGKDALLSGGVPVGEMQLYLPVIMNPVVAAGS